MSKKKTEDDAMDSGINGIDLILQNVSQPPPPEAQTEGMSQEAVKRLIQEQLQQNQPTPSPPNKKKKKKSPLTRKPGIYLSVESDDRLDQEWRNQPRQPGKKRKSKSWIVEEILRRHWGLPLLEE